MSTNKTILIVDDIRINTILLKRMLDATPYNVVAVESGAEALNFISNNQVDLVFLDIMMPIMNGYEVLSNIRKNEATKELPVVVTSALCSQHDIDVAMGKGASDYLTKPINQADLLDLVAKYLG